MYYDVEEAFQRIPIEGIRPDHLTLGICCMSDYEELYKHGIQIDSHIWEEFKSPEKKHSENRLDAYDGYSFGVLYHIFSDAFGIHSNKVGLYFHDHLVIVFCEQEQCRNTIFQVLHKINSHTCCLEHMISLILETVIENSRSMIRAIEETIERLDEQIMQNKTDHFQAEIAKIRKRILRLTHYFDGIQNVCDELLEDENAFFSKKYVHHIRIYHDRVQRIAGNVHMLRDYAVQVREQYQSQMDLNLNHIMYVFTVVTVVFLPLTLIVGWYGMNFTSMPELQWRYGYFFVIGLSITVILFCFWYFHKKKLLKK